jgi:hypothetical protein
MFDVPLVGYSMNALIEGGYRNFSQSIFLVLEMSAIATGLTSIVWMVSPRFHRLATWLGLGIRTALETALILTLYAAAVFLWRNQWTAQKRMSEIGSLTFGCGHLSV